MRYSRRILLGLLGLGYAVALAHGGLGIASLPAFAALCLAGWLVRPAHGLWLKSVGHGLFVVLALALALHAVPGFDNARVIDGVRFTPDAAPFSMNLNLDKPLIGLWLLLVCPWVIGVRSPRLASSLAIAVLTTLACLATGRLLGIVDWAVKWPAQTWIWTLNNLLLVSLTEEALFRGYLQGGLQRLLAPLRRGPDLALAGAALLFGLAHVGGGWPWVALATLAGVGYGLAWRQGGLPAALLAHFVLNLMHFLLFTYPSLATA